MASLLAFVSSALLTDGYENETLIQESDHAVFGWGMLQLSDNKQKVGIMFALDVPISYVAEISAILSSMSFCEVLDDPMFFKEEEPGVFEVLFDEDALEAHAIRILKLCFYDNYESQSPSNFN